MVKILLSVILIIMAIILGLLTQQVAEIKAQAILLPAQIDLLVSASDKVINLDCPPCPECKDYTPDFDKLRKGFTSYAYVYPPTSLLQPSTPSA